MTTNVQKKHLAGNLYGLLPASLRCLLNIEDPQERDLLLISSLAAISACLPNYFGYYRDSYNEKVSCHLYTLIVGPTGSGKSSAFKEVRRLVNQIDAELYERCRKDKERYKYELANAEGLEERRAISSPFKERITISANLTDASLLKNLAGAEHGALMMSDEADIFISSMENGYGAKLSPILRSAFHHNTVTVIRSTDEYEEKIYFPKLAVLLAGTPNCLDTFANQKNVHNGLYNRFMVYSLEKRNTRCVQRVSSKDSELRFLTEELYKVFYRLFDREVPLFFYRTKEQSDLMAEMVNTKYERLWQDEDYSAVLSRLLLSCFRILGILTAIRNADHLKTAEELFVSDDDLNFVLGFFDLLVAHNVYTYETVNEGVNFSKKPTFVDVLKKLPSFFTHKQFITLYSLMRRTNTRASEYKISKLCKKGIIIKSSENDDLYTWKPK